MSHKELPSVYDWEISIGKRHIQKKSQVEFDKIKGHCIKGLKSATPEDIPLLVSLCSDTIALLNYSLKVTGLDRGLNPDLISDTLQKEADKKLKQLTEEI